MTRFETEVPLEAPDDFVTIVKDMERRITRLEQIVSILHVEMFSTTKHPESPPEAQEATWGGLTERLTLAETMAMVDKVEVSDGNPTP